MSAGRTSASWLEILWTDQHQRWFQGDRIPVEAYVARNPTLRAEPEHLLELVYREVVLHKELGETPQLAEYLHRFPQLAAQLPPLFEVDEYLESEPLPAERPVSRCGDPEGPSPLEERFVPGRSNQPERLGGYRVQRPIGAGGRGTVFLAEQGALQRLAALKILNPELAACPDAEERFLREGRTWASIRHDHLVTIYEADEENGVLFLAMEYLQGESLAARLQHAAPLPVAEAGRIGRGVAEGLAAVHAHNLLHRDIKPSNVWLEAPQDRVKILDFGLARPVSDVPRIAPSGAVVGTAAYMSPEQAQGAELDPRSDLFSLGSLLYEMTTGRSPFEGPNLLATLDPLRIHNPLPPRTCNPAVPEALSALVMRLLAKEPGERPATAAKVVEALRALERRCQPAATPGTWRRWTLVAAAALLLVLAGLVCLLRLH